MHCALCFELFPQGDTVGAAVDDDQKLTAGLPVTLDLKSQLVPGARLSKAVRQLIAHPRERLIKPVNFFAAGRNNFPHVAQALKRFCTNPFSSMFIERGLGCGANHQGDSVVLGEQIEYLQDRREHARRQRLCLVQNDDAIGDVM